MTAYAITSWSQRGDYDVVLAAMETKLETVLAAKTIRLQAIVPRGPEFVGLLQYDT